MTDSGAAAPAAEGRSPWLDVIRWPLGGGMLGGVLILAAMALGMAAFEGGATQPDRETRAYGRFACLVVAGLTLAIYTRRAVTCTWPEERPVPWGRDEQDDVPWTSAVANFAAALVPSFLPLIVWLVVRGPLAPSAWLDWTVLVVTMALGCAAFPLALAGSIVKGSVLAALPRPVLRMARAEPHAARVAAAAALVAGGLLVVSALVAAYAVKNPSGSFEADLSARAREAYTVPGLLVALLFVLRGAGFYAALVAARVAGLLVREVPAMAEAT